VNSEDVKWDQETEVLILGAGPGGFSAAQAAAAAGARTVMVEKRGELGGNAS
jgi:dihydrolipoamide dehydrogenase